MRNIGDILRMVVGLRLVGLVLGLTGINSLQNANSTSNYQPNLPSTGNPSNSDLIYATPANESCRDSFFPRVSSLRLLFLLIALLLIDFGFGLPERLAIGFYTQ